MQDIERGPVSKLEKVLSVWRRLLIQRRNIIILCSLWIVFCLVLWGVPEKMYDYCRGVNFTAAYEEIKEQLPVVEPAPVAPPEDVKERFEYVRNHVNLYDGVASAQYEFNGRLRNDVDVFQISAGLDTVIRENDFYCLAGIHIGFPKHIMKIGGRVYVNSKIIGHDTEVIGYKEESAFYPNYEVLKNRYTKIELEYFDEHGYKQTSVLEDINAICAQHLLDTLNGIKFKVADEL